jgi:hypothetical protein
MASLWRFRGFKSESGEELIRKWYRDASGDKRAKFTVTMKFLDERQQSEWGTPRQSPRFKQLSGVLTGYGEIRFFADKVQQRPIGRFTAKGEFTILFFAIEVGNKLRPKETELKKILDERKSLISANKEKYTHEWKV